MNDKKLWVVETGMGPLFFILLFFFSTDLGFLPAACVTRLKLHAQVLDEKHRL